MSRDRLDYYAYRAGAAALWGATLGLATDRLSAPLRRAALKDEFARLARECRGGIETLDASKQVAMLAMLAAEGDRDHAAYESAG